MVVVKYGGPRLPPVQGWGRPFRDRRGASHWFQFDCRSLCRGVWFDGPLAAEPDQWTRTCAECARQLRSMRGRKG